MKILYVITGLGQGGAERVVCDLADEMYKRGNKVKIAYLTGEILTSPAHKEIELIKINLNSIIALPVAYLNLSKLIKNYKPDIVHAHMIHANLLTRLIRLTTPIHRLICTAHSANEGGRLRMFFYRITHNLGDVMTNVSNFASNIYIEKMAVPRKEIITVYNGIDFTRFKYDKFAKKNIQKELNIDSETKILLAVGRFHPAKNYFNLINAFKILKEKSSIPFCLLIAGDGELRPQLEKLIIDLELEENIILLGRRNDIPKLMSACDIFVLSSNYEGLPTVLIEALACQAHVVSTDVSGAREIVGEDFGRVVKINDSHALANAIHDISLNNTSRNVLGNTYVNQKFNLDIVADNWISIYNEN